MEPINSTQKEVDAGPVEDDLSAARNATTDTVADQPVVAGGVASSTDTGPSLVLDDPYKPRLSFREKLTNGMSWYGLELLLSTVGLLVTTVVLNYGIYALVNYMKGIDDPTASRFVGEFSIWVAAVMVVWLPLTVFFYLRTRAEADLYPATKARMVHKVLVGVFLFQVVLLAAGTLFSVVYSLVRMAVGIDDQVGDTFVRVVIPGILATLVNGGLVMAYSKGSKISRSLFSIVLSVLCVGVISVLLALSVSAIQGNARDEKAVSDLETIQDNIIDYYQTKQSLPKSLNDLDRLKTDTKNRLSRYTYKREDGDRYQLCATFVTDTLKQNGYGESVAVVNNYSEYASFSLHGTGEKCFKLTTYQYFYPVQKSTRSSSSY